MLLKKANVNIEWWIVMEIRVVNGIAFHLAVKLEFIEMLSLTNVF